MQQRSIILLNGSPKPGQSTSGAMSDFMAGHFEKNNQEPKQVKICAYLKSDEKVRTLVEYIKTADIVILFTPLYVDSVPYHVIKFMEIIREQLEEHHTNANKKFAVFCQSGMERTKNRVALEICKCFAGTAGFDFAGGFALGFAGILNGLPLPNLNRLTGNIQKALSITADCLSQGNPIPGETVNKLLAKPLLPGPMFVKLFLFNSTMKTCLKKKDFSNGLKPLHSKLKLFFS